MKEGKYKRKQIMNKASSKKMGGIKVINNYEEYAKIKQEGMKQEVNEMEGIK